MGRRFKGRVAKKLKKADKLNCVYVIIIGQDELDNNLIQLKYLQTGEQKQLSFDAAMKIIKNQYD